MSLVVLIYGLLKEETYLWKGCCGSCCKSEANIHGTCFSSSQNDLKLATRVHMYEVRLNPNDLALLGQCGSLTAHFSTRNM
eukprot:scaffold7913_cov100-Skeletonema_dohrnii-CCMP3373.AAC.4